MRLFTLLATTLLTLGRTCAATAAPVELPPAPLEASPSGVLLRAPTLDLHERLTVGDGFALFGLALGGGAIAGGTAGSLATLGALSVNGEGHFDVSMGIGVAVGSVAGSFGAAGAMHLYGQARDLGGSFWAGAAGGAAGALLTALVVVPVLSEDDNDAFVPILSYALIPTIGAFTGYVLSCALSDHVDLDDAPPSGGLLDVTPEHGVRLGVPAISITPRPDGDTLVHVGLVGGHF